MRICLSRAAHLSANEYANGCDMDMNVDMDMEVKSKYIGDFSPRDQSINKSFKRPK